MLTVTRYRWIPSMIYTLLLGTARLTFHSTASVYSNTILSFQLEKTTQQTRPNKIFSNLEKHQFNYTTQLSIIK